MCMLRHGLIGVLTIAPAVAVAQATGGEGATTASTPVIQLLLGVAVGLAGLMAVGLVIARPEREPPIKITWPALGGLVLAAPFTAAAVAAMVWLEALWPGIVVGVSLGGAYVAVIRWWWRRSG